jgi:hypothetical protein
MSAATEELLRLAEAALRAPGVSAAWVIDGTGEERLTVTAFGEQVCSAHR